MLELEVLLEMNPTCFRFRHVAIKAIDFGRCNYMELVNIPLVRYCACLQDMC